MIAVPHLQRAGVLIAAMGLTALVIAGLVWNAAASGGARSAVPEQAAPKRPSLHASPAGDAAALNTAAERRLPPSLARHIPANGRPGVIFFLKSDCECSRGFAIMMTSLAPHLQPFANCTVVIEGTAADAESFAAETGLTIPFIAQPESDLARDWGVAKAGCFALLMADGAVEAVWPGISRQGVRDLAGRLGVEPPVPAALLAEMPGAAMAGCPLGYAASVRAGGVKMPPGPGPSAETSR